MYSLPKNAVAQHIEIRKERIDNGYVISGAITVDESGKIKFRFDDVQPLIDEYDMFKEAMTNFLKKLGILEKIAQEKINQENAKKDVFFQN